MYRQRRPSDTFVIMLSDKICSIHITLLFFSILTARICVLLFYLACFLLQLIIPTLFFKKAKGILQSPHVAYQIDGDDKQNRMQVKFSS